MFSAHNVSIKLKNCGYELHHTRKKGSHEKNYGGTDIVELDFFFKEQTPGITSRWKNLNIKK